MDSPQFQAVFVPLKLPAWELAGDLDMEARVLGPRPVVGRLSVLPSGASVAPALEGRPWGRGGGAGLCAEAPADITSAGVTEALRPDGAGVLGEGTQSYLLSRV